MTTPQALEIFELDMPRCALRYGTTNGAGTCPAVLGVDSDDKCHNTPNTCPVRDSYVDDDPLTLRFAKNTADLPRELNCIPVIEAVEVSPSIVSLGRGLGQRESVRVTMKDRPHSDTGGLDPYLDERAYDPYYQGTLFGKLRARSPFLRWRDARLLHGFAGQALADFVTRHYLVDAFDGPSADARYSVIAKDPLKGLDDDRAQAPAPSNGFLVADITAAAVELVLSPAGIGDDEYDAAGWVNLGGKEIAAYYRDVTAGNDADTLLLLNFHGADASTVFTDSSAHARVDTNVGNAQIDTADYKFPSSAGLFDGSGDCVTFPDSNDWTFSGDFTIEGFFKFSSLAANRTLFGHGSGSTNQYRLFVTTAGAITFEMIVGGVTGLSIVSATGQIGAGWHHIALERTGNTWRIYVDGAVISSPSSGASFTNYAGTFRVGADGNSANGMAGWIGMFRVSNVARWSAAFTPPVAPYTVADGLTLLRGQFNTEAVAHSAQDRVQKCLYIQAQDPAAIIADLIENYAQIDPAYIPLANWLVETEAFLGPVYTAFLAEPTGVKTLITELIEQAALSIWWNPIDREIKLRVLRAIADDADTYGESQYLKSSLKLTDQPALRVSQVWSYFAQINPLKKIDDLDNFRSTALTADLQAEADYGSPAIKRIFSRWIPQGGRSIALTMNAKHLARYRDPPRRISFAVMRSSPEVPRTDPALGGGYQLAGWMIQDRFGAPATAPIVVTSVKADAAVLEIEAEENVFAAVEGAESTNHDIIIDANTLNLNVRVMHDALYGTPEPGDVVNFHVLESVIVGSTSTATPAVDLGTWPTDSVTGKRTSGSPILTDLADTSDYTVGMRVAGAGIQAGSKILTVDSGTQITLDKNATSGSATTTTLTISLVLITVILVGRIQGKGGAGYGRYTPTASAAESGGAALYTRAALDLDIVGELFGGGGGGGSFMNSTFEKWRAGGGGAGTQPGAAGISNGGDYTQPDPGTADAGGIGARKISNPTQNPAPDGGGPGLAGQDATGGSNYQKRDGGEAGAAIDGASYVNVIVGPGDRRGGEIN